MKLTKSKLIELILEQEQEIGRDRGRSTPGSSFSNWLAENPPKDWNLTNYTESFMRKMGQSKSSSETKTLTLGAVGFALIQAGKTIGWGNALQLLFTPLILKVDGADRAEELERKINSRGLDGYTDWLKENWDFIFYYLPKTWAVMLSRDLGDMYLQQYNMNLKSIYKAGLRVFAPKTGLGLSTTAGGGKRKFADLVKDQYLEDYPWEKLGANGVFPVSLRKIINSIEKLKKLGWQLSLDKTEVANLAETLKIIEVSVLEKNVKSQKLQNKISTLIEQINDYFSKRETGEGYKGDKPPLFFKLYISEPEEATMVLTEIFLLRLIKMKLGYVTSRTMFEDSKYKQKIENWKKRFIRMKFPATEFEQEIVAPVDPSENSTEARLANKIIPVMIKRILKSGLEIDVPRAPNTGVLPAPKRRLYGKAAEEYKKEQERKKRIKSFEKFADMGR